MRFFRRKKKIDNFSSINNDNYKCKNVKEEEDLNEKVFYNQKNIQDLSNYKNDDLDEPVYELIINDENVELIKCFDKIKINFIKDIDNYLYLENNVNLYPLLSQIISNENSNEIYKNKIKNQISIIKENEKMFIFNYLTILLIGKIGTGKSTLINALFKKKLAITGIGRGATTVQTMPYMSIIGPYLRSVDTRGIESNKYYGLRK